MTRTTPPRPVDITAAFPQLAPMARTTTRLHPRPGEPGARQSSIGGPLLWPADEPWPSCSESHRRDDPAGLGRATTAADVRRFRALRANADQRPPGEREFTPQEQAEADRIAAGRPWPEDCEPIALLPLAQLLAVEVPGLRPPPGADLLQVLWCPFEHPDRAEMPLTRLYWRASAAVGEVLGTPPEPVAVAHRLYVPIPCLLQPEQVTEYPAPLELGWELEEQLTEWSAQQKAGVVPGDPYHEIEEQYYQHELSVAPGCKVGGWAPWSFVDPEELDCEACDTRLVPLLTVASGEWDGAGTSWIPYEDLADGAALAPPASAPTGITIGDAYNQQLYICPADPTHPHAELMQ